MKSLLEDGDQNPHLSIGISLGRLVELEKAVAELGETHLKWDEV